MPRKLSNVVTGGKKINSQEEISVNIELTNKSIGDMKVELRSLSTGGQHAEYVGQTKTPNNTGHVTLMPVFLASSRRWANVTTNTGRVDESSLSSHTRAFCVKIMINLIPLYPPKPRIV